MEIGIMSSEKKKKEERTKSYQPHFLSSFFVVE